MPRKKYTKFIFIKLFQNLHRLCNNFFSKDSTGKLITQIIFQLSTTNHASVKYHKSYFS